MTIAGKVVIPVLACLWAINTGGSVESESKYQQSNPSLCGELIAEDKLRADLDYLFTTISQVHPNMHAYTNPEDYVLMKEALYEYVDHAMMASEFYVCVQPVVYYLKDSHTMVSRPPNFVMPAITESLRKFGGTLKKLVKGNGPARKSTPYVQAPRKKEYAGPYSYHFFPQNDTCLMVVNSFGMPDQVKQYIKGFHKTFTTIKEKKITHLIIDIRENQGGCGLVGDELLKYLAKKPFRQIEKIEQRIVPDFFELCEQYGLDIKKTMLDEYGIDLENLKSKGHYKSGIIIEGQGSFKNPHPPSERFEGSIYLLVAEPTFSAASNFAAAVQYFKIGTLIGQETSGEKDHYGQVLPITLPHSRLNGQVSTAHFVTVGGTEDRGGVKPEYEVRQKPEDTAKGVDTVLEFTLNMIKNNGIVSDTQLVN